MRWTPAMKQESRDLATAVLATSRHLQMSDANLSRRLGVSRACVGFWRAGTSGLASKRVVAAARQFIREGAFVPIPPTPNIGDGINGCGGDSHRTRMRRRPILRTPAVSAHTAPVIRQVIESASIPAAVTVLHQSAKRMPVAEWFGLFRALATAKG